MYRLMQMFTMGELNIVLQQPEKSLFIIKHPDRKTVEEEIQYLKIRPDKQPMKELIAWENFLKPNFARLNDIRMPEL